MDYNKLFRKLLIYYYAAFTLFFLTAFCCSYLIKMPLVKLQTPLAINLQSAAILYVVCSVPFALWFFHKKVMALRVLSDEKKYSGYFKFALFRIALISFGVILNLLFFYLLKDMSLIYCAAIASLAFIFCKPNARKIEAELTLPENMNEAKESK